MMEAATDKADSEGLVSAMLRAKWNKTKFDTMDAVAEAKDLDSASEEFMIAALMKKLTALKANKTKFAGAESADDEFLIKAMLAKLVALKRNKVRSRGERGVCVRSLGARELGVDRQAFEKIVGGACRFLFERPASFPPPAPNHTAPTPFCCSHCLLLFHPSLNRPRSSSLTWRRWTSPPPTRCCCRRCSRSSPPGRPPRRTPPSSSPLTPSPPTPLTTR